MPVRKNADGGYEYYETAETVYQTSGDQLAFQRRLVELQDRKAAVLSQYDLSVAAAARNRDDQLAGIAAELAKVQAVLDQIARDAAPAA